MDLSDFEPIQTDENTGTTFGENSQIKVLGFYRKSKYVKIYLIHCSDCSKDKELFGEGIFHTQLCRLKIGQLPCGCSKVHRWSEKERIVLIERKCKEKGYNFLGYAEDHGPFDTRKLILECPKHGIWKTTNFGSFTQKSSVGCKGCAIESNHQNKPENPDLVLNKVNTLISELNLAEKGISFLGFKGEHKNHGSKISFSCKEHGEYSISVNQFLSKKTSCRKCSKAETAERLRDDQKMIRSFFDTGKFSSGTKFSRSTEKDKRGCYSRWDVFCPDCNCTTNCYYGSLQIGVKSCECREEKRNEAYINLVFDSNTPIAVKFGISSNSKLRNIKLNSKSIYKIELVKVFKFERELDCYAAETKCKQSLTCRILDKQSLPDGWTETTSINNLEKIIEIYKSFGGLELE